MGESTMDATERDALRATLDGISTALSAAYAALDRLEEQPESPPRRRITGSRAGAQASDEVSPYFADEDGTVHVFT